MLKIIQASLMSDDPAADVAFPGYDEHDGAFQVIQTGNTVSVNVRQPDGRFRRVDQLLDASRVDPKAGKGGWTFTGRSTNLLDTGVSPEDATVTFSVEGRDGCPSCH